MRNFHLGLSLLLVLVLSTSPGCASSVERNIEPEVEIKPTNCLERVPENAYTKVQLLALTKVLELNDNGTLRRIEASEENFNTLKLLPQEFENMNMAIDEINESTNFGYFIVEPDFSNVAMPILLAAKGYWWCVAKVIKCELLTVGCIAAAPACVASCAGVCAGTLGLGCVACVAACTAGGIALCDSAYDCWVEADAAGCIP